MFYIFDQVALISFTSTANKHFDIFVSIASLYGDDAIEFIVAKTFLHNQV